jgi:hypothetical protein
LPDAQAAGARLIVETRADHVRIEAGAATGVEARSRSGHRVAVRCKVVVVACGSIHTPALLLRSGLRNEHIGHHLHLHPVSNVSGIFEEEIRPWEGTMQAIYSDEFRLLTGNYGVKYETTALQPAVEVAALPWRDPAHYRSLLEKLSRTVGIGVLLRDRDGGRVTVDGQGNPVSHYALSEFDRGGSPDFLSARAMVRVRAGRAWRARSLRRIDGFRRMECSSLGALLLSHHGQRPYGRVAQDIRHQPRGPDVGYS